jgi:hypothetical protein
MVIVNCATNSIKRRREDHPFQACELERSTLLAGTAGRVRKPGLQPEINSANENRSREPLSLRAFRVN